MIYSHGVTKYSYIELKHALSSQYEVTIMSSTVLSSHSEIIVRNSYGVTQYILNSHHEVTYNEL
jgi:hypothetical protein